MNKAELQTLAELDSGEARRRHLERTPSRADPRAGGRLIAEVNRALRVDLDEAERLAAALHWLAEAVDDGPRWTSVSAVCDSTTRRPAEPALESEQTT